MFIEQMRGYSLPTLATWPHPFYENSLWHIYELKRCEDGSLKWYQGFIELETKHVKADVYDSYEFAVNVAVERNNKLSEAIDNIGLSFSEQESLQLKVEKEVTRKCRLFGEEQLMLSEGIRRNQDAPSPSIKDITLPDNFQNLYEPLMETLKDTPCINFVRLNKYGISLIKTKENDWSTRGKHNRETSKLFYREKIATSFGLSGSEHWGKTKSKIRKMLLPRANQLLQLASVKRILAEAEHQGTKVVVVSGFVFWFEENDNVGWIVKEVSYSEVEKSGNTLWKKGTILSKNHGRIVVLPYVKENGELIQGHTKNSSHDGKANPRRPKEYLELPYEVLEDDLMIGLFGELNYE